MGWRVWVRDGNDCRLVSAVVFEGLVDAEDYAKSLADYMIVPAGAVLPGADTASRQAMKQQGVTE